MARPASIQIKQLKELQAAMKRGESALEPKDVNPILAGGLQIIKDEAYRNLMDVTERGTVLPPGWEHIEDALVVQQGKSPRIASAFAKVFRRKAPQAIWIEFGHRIVGHRPKKTDTGKTVAPRPFFRPAIKAKRAAARRFISRGIKDLLLLAFYGSKKDDGATLPE